MREAADLIWARSESEWKRPLKTQTTQQWRYMAKVALGVLDVIGVDEEDVNQALDARFGAAGLRALEHLVPSG